MEPVSTWGAPHKLRFDTIHIIESLPAGELRTGTRVYDEIRPLALMARPAVNCCLWSEHTRELFLSRLWWIATDAKQNRHSPILQIETHGTVDGIEVGSGEFIPWSDLKQPLTAINQAGRLNLLVVMSACEGARLVEQMGVEDRAPVHSLIGPRRTVAAGELERATLAFYRKLFADCDARAAWCAMNLAVAPQETTFGAYTAEFMLRYVMRLYLKTLCSEEALEVRRLKIEDQLAVDGCSPEFIELARDSLRAVQRNHRPFFHVVRERFFFCDLYPENRTRFQVTFEDCLPEPGAD